MPLDVTNMLRRKMIKDSLATYEERGERKSLSIEYRGSDTALEVIRIPPKYASGLGSKPSDH